MNLLIAFVAKYLIAVPVLVLLAYFLFSKGRRLTQLLWLSAIALPLAFVLSRLAGMLYSDPRPFVTGHFTPLFSQARDNGFPSDHTLLAATIAMLVLYVDKRVGTVLWIITLLIGVSRIFAGVHHVVDIIGSIVISIFSVVFAQYLIVKFRRS